VTGVTDVPVTNVTEHRVTPITDTAPPRGASFAAMHPTGRTKGVTGVAEKKISPKKSGAKSSAKKAATRVTKKTSLRRRRKR
jgi:hypothetical protein